MSQFDFLRLLDPAPSKVLFCSGGLFSCVVVRLSRLPRQKGAPEALISSGLLCFGLLQSKNAFWHSLSPVQILPTDKTTLNYQIDFLTTRQIDLFGFAIRGASILKLRLAAASSGWKCLFCRAPNQHPSTWQSNPTWPTRPSPHLLVLSNREQRHYFCFSSLFSCLLCRPYQKFHQASSILTIAVCISLTGIDLLIPFRFQTRLTPSSRRPNSPCLSKHILTVVP